MPGRVSGEGIAVKGIFDLPKRIGVTSKQWDEANGVEPFVDADEIFLGGRDITFQGIMLGTKAQIETNLFNLKTAIDAFNATVAFETPYGNACVIVQKITPKIYIGGATVIIEFREPKIGASCGISTPDTVYKSDAYSETAIKNNCASGYDGSTVTFTSPAEQFISNTSKAEANLRAVEWVRERKQDYANVNGTCTLKPVIYYNEAQTVGLTKNDCASGYVGSMVYYTVPAYTMAYNSNISLLDANAKAFAAAYAMMTQAYANANGSCSMLPTFILINKVPWYFLWSIAGYYLDYEVGPAVPPGTYYNVMIYGVIVTYVSGVSDTAADVVTALAALINAKTWEQWNANNQAFTFGEPPWEPVAYLDTANVLKLQVPGNQPEIWIGQNPPWWDNLIA